MKGNLSKKKGFLGKLEEKDLESIADIVKTHYGKDLEDIKVDIGELEYKKESVENRTDVISETTNERRGKYASAEAVYDYGQKIKEDAKKYTDSLESKHNKRFNTVETNLGTIQTELTEQLSEIESKVEKDIQDLESKHDKSINTVEEDIIKLEYKKENAANRTDKISETTNERRGKYASAEAVYDYGQKIKNEANKYTDSLESKHDKRINTVKEDIIKLEDKKENAANRTDKISETQNERIGKYASAEAVYRYGSEIKNKANEYTDVMFDEVVVQFEEADKVIRSDVANVRTLANDAYNIAKGASRAIAFENYQKFCEYILAEGMAFKENYPIGTTILIAKSGVPDLWYYEETDDYSVVIPTDEEIAGELESVGYFNIGYYKFAAAESSKIILDGYVQLDEFLDHSQDEDIHTTQKEKEIWNNKLDKANSEGGFVAGNYKEGDTVTSGVLIGKNAYAEQDSNISPVTIGEDATGHGGVAIGYNASSFDGGTVVGVNANGGGVSIGYNAKAIGRHDVIIDGEVIESIENYPIDAIQLGSGTNKNEKTLQVYDFQLLDAEGNIPKERLKNAGGGGGSVDLSNYFTKNETKDEINTAIQSAIGDVLGGAS